MLSGRSTSPPGETNGRRHHHPHQITTRSSSPSPSSPPSPSPPMASANSSSPPHSAHQIFGAVALYWVVSLSMVFANKTLLGGASVPSAPMFVTWFQCVITTLFCYIAPRAGITSVPPFEVKKDILIQMVPLAGVFTGMILLNNLCLRFVELSFYNVARSLTIVCSIFLDFVLLGQTTSIPAVACCGLVVVGFLLGNQQELRWSLSGVLFGVGSSMFVALNAVYVKKKFPLVDNNPWKITLYNNLLASFLFVPLILFGGEIPIILSTPALRTPTFWSLMVIAGLMGVGISFATATQIKFTSPLTHNVSATAKAAAQTIIALAVYQNPITVLGGLSVAIILVGSLAYTLVRRAEMQKKASDERDSAPEKETLVSTKA